MASPSSKNAEFLYTCEGHSPCQLREATKQVEIRTQAVDEHLKETQGQYQTLERKYSKAKRLIKEYQQKEIEFLKKETAQRRAQEESEVTHKEEADNLQEKISDLETKVDALKTPTPS
uniref:Uncharacterized protein n=1 Tax=Gasterosteus aculeatus aculeatus TaxID=481459 RepID=A0AAQ4R0P1_GASAC